MDEAVLEAAGRAVEARWPDLRPIGGMILGSGWGGVAEGFEIHDRMAYADIPGLGATGVAGHAGWLLRASVGKRDLLIFQGRRHWYEGVGWTPVAIPVHILRRAGAPMVLITNAAGSLDAGYKPGDLLIVKDHINLMGTNPLIGPHRPDWGPRFPDQSHVYDRHLIERLEQCGHAIGLSLHRGIYIALTGPTYETPAEVCFLAMLGGQAVGMSTVPEAILANAAGLKVAAMSCLSNLAAGLTAHPLSHDDVFASVQGAMPDMRRLLVTFWKETDDVDHPTT